MERTITGTVGEVKGRTVNTKYGEKTVFDITIGSQKTSTFKSDIAEEANALKGSDVEATVREEQRGDYTNYMLLGVKLVDAYPAAQQTNDATGFKLPGGTYTSTIPVTAAPEYQRRMHPDVEARITRLSCLDTAFQYAGQMGNSEDDAIALAQRLFGVAMDKKYPQPVAATATETTEDVPW